MFGLSCVIGHLQVKLQHLYSVILQLTTLQKRLGVSNFPRLHIYLFWTQCVNTPDWNTHQISLITSFVSSFYSDVLHLHFCDGVWFHSVNLHFLGIFLVCVLVMDTTEQWASWDSLTSQTSDHDRVRCIEVPGPHIP